MEHIYAPMVPIFIPLWIAKNKVYNGNAGELLAK